MDVRLKLALLAALWVVGVITLMRGGASAELSGTNICMTSVEITETILMPRLFPIRTAFSFYCVGRFPMCQDEDTEYLFTFVEMRYNGTRNVKGCCTGYTPDAENVHCIPLCAQGCFHGTCSAPDLCFCDEGFTGQSCNEIQELYLTRTLLSLNIDALHAEENHINHAARYEDSRLGITYMEMGFMVLFAIWLYVSHRAFCNLVKECGLLIPWRVICHDIGATIRCFCCTTVTAEDEEAPAVDGGNEIEIDKVDLEAPPPYNELFPPMRYGQGVCDYQSNGSTHVHVSGFDATDLVDVDLDGALDIYNMDMDAIETGPQCTLFINNMQNDGHIVDYPGYLEDMIPGCSINPYPEDVDDYDYSDDDMEDDEGYDFYDHDEDDIVVVIDMDDGDEVVVLGSISEEMVEPVDDEESWE